MLIGCHGFSGCWWQYFWFVCLNIGAYADLAETVAEPSLQATQLKLKRARLADDLNEKIAQRPGPMELVEKNILPVATSLKEAIIGKCTDHMFQGGLRFVCIHQGCVIIKYDVRYKYKCVTCTNSILIHVLWYWNVTHHIFYLAQFMFLQFT